MKRGEKGIPIGFSRVRTFTDTNGIEKILFVKTLEVSNYEYNKFLESIKEDTNIQSYQRKRHYYYSKPITQKDKDFLLLAGETKSDLDDYPVVNISKDAAIAYTNWLNSVEPDSNYYYRLPKLEEWNHFFNDVDDSMTYSWGGLNYIDEEGNLLANFALMDQSLVRYDQIKDSIYFEENTKTSRYKMYLNGPKPVYSYIPNSYGVFNLSGNVAEYILDKDYTKGGSWHSPVHYLRKSSKEYYSYPSPFVGFRVVRIVPREYYEEQN